MRFPAAMRERGFTLVELSVSMATVACVMAICIAWVPPMTEVMQADADLQLVKAQVMLAREMAVNQRRSIELEFLHVLCAQEANAVDDAGARPFQRAQADFAARHPGAWLRAFADDAARVAPGSAYALAAAAVADFVSADLAWQDATLGPR